MPSGSPNQNKLKPLSDAAWGILLQLYKDGPIPSYRINPGIRHRLYRESLIIFTVGTGANVGKSFVAITAEGRKKWEERRR